MGKEYIPGCLLLVALLKSAFTPEETIFGQFYNDFSGPDDLVAYGYHGLAPPSLKGNTGALLHGNFSHTTPMPYSYRLAPVTTMILEYEMRAPESLFANTYNPVDVEAIQYTYKEDDFLYDNSAWRRNDFYEEYGSPAILHQLLPPPQQPSASNVGFDSPSYQDQSQSPPELSLQGPPISVDLPAYLKSFSIDEIEPTIVEPIESIQSLLTTTANDPLNPSDFLDHVILRDVATPLPCDKQTQSWAHSEWEANSEEKGAVGGPGMFSMEKVGQDSNWFEFGLDAQRTIEPFCDTSSKPQKVSIDGKPPYSDVDMELQFPFQTVLEPSDPFPASGYLDAVTPQSGDVMEVESRLFLTMDNIQSSTPHPDQTEAHHISESPLGLSSSESSSAELLQDHNYHVGSRPHVDASGALGSPLPLVYHARTPELPAFYPNQPRGPLGSDDYRLQQLRVPHTSEQIVTCEPDEFASIIKALNNEEQRQLARNIRKRGRNRLAASKMRGKVRREEQQVRAQVSEMRQEREILRGVRWSLQARLNEQAAHQRALLAQLTSATGGTKGHTRGFETEYEQQAG